MNICLIGFMGSGKTTIGQGLSERLNYEWIDLDVYIEAKTQKDIPTLFNEYGESYFRKLEQECLKEVILKENCVISTGGGVITSPENIQVLQEVCSIYLKYPFEVLYNRIAGDENRPLVTSKEALETRFLDRLDLYEKASRVKMECTDKSIDQIIQEIINYLERMS